MLDKYPINRDHMIKIVEQKQAKLFETLKATSVGLIRLASDENTKNQAIQSIPHYEALWDDVFKFYSKWKMLIIQTSETFLTDNDRLNSELELIEQNLTTESQTINTVLITIKRKNEQQ